MMQNGHITTSLHSIHLRNLVPDHVAALCCPVQVHDATAPPSMCFHLLVNATDAPSRLHLATPPQVPQTPLLPLQLTPIIIVVVITAH